LRQENEEARWKLLRIWSLVPKSRTEIEFSKKVIGEALEKSEEANPSKLTPVSAVKIIDDNVQNVDRPMSKTPLKRYQNWDGAWRRELYRLAAEMIVILLPCSGRKGGGTFAPGKTERIAIELASRVGKPPMAARNLSFKLVDGRGRNLNNGLWGYIPSQGDTHAEVSPSG
jgi:hypothetical protein